MPDRILVLGAGAIGMYVGGSLAYSGEEVVFFDRAEVQPLLSANGIQIHNRDGFTKSIAHPTIVSTLDQLSSLAPFRFALLAVKSYDTANLLEKISPIQHKLPPIVSLQNGVENETLIRKQLRGIEVIPASVTTAIGKPDSHTIIVEKLRGIALSSIEHISTEVCSLLSKADLNCRLYTNSVAMKWSKLLTNITANATSAILGMTPGEILRDPGLFNLEMMQIREALQVMSAQKLPVLDLPGTPVKAFAFISRYFPRVLSQPLLIQSIAKGRGEKMPSFFLDLASGRGKSEVEYLNGAVVRVGASYQVHCPVNHLLTDTLMGITLGNLDPQDFYKNPASLIKRL